MSFANPKREQCNHQRRAAGKPYPRTCLICGLGPCEIDQLKFDFGDAEPVYLGMYPQPFTER